jgi:hypothetical protein
MAEQELDASHIGAAFEQVGGEAVPQRMRGDALVDARGPGGFAQHPVNRFARQPCPRPGFGVARKQLRAGRSIGFPVLTQGHEHAWTQHHVALAGLTFAHPQEHALAVDVAGLEAGDFAHAQPRAVGQHEDGAVLERGGRPEQPRHFAPAQELAHHAWDFGLRDRRRGIATDGRPQQAADRTELDVSGARAARRVHKSVQVPFDVSARDCPERPIDVGKELAGTPGVGGQTVGCQAAQRHPAAHPTQTLLDVRFANHGFPPRLRRRD